MRQNQPTTRRCQRLPEKKAVIGRVNENQPLAAADELKLVADFAQAVAMAFDYGVHAGGAEFGRLRRTAKTGTNELSASLTSSIRLL